LFGIGVFVAANFDRTNRQSGKWKEPKYAMSIFRMNTTGLAS
jgi:hypothetical protein